MIQAHKFTEHNVCVKAWMKTSSSNRMEHLLLKWLIKEIPNEANAKKSKDTPQEQLQYL